MTIGDITVVIPTVGRQVFRECLRALADSTAWPAHLVIVDQSRSADVARWLADVSEKGMRVEHVPDARTGQGAALNTGIERVRTPFVAVTDDDCMVAPDWLATMRARLVGTDRTIVSGPMDPAGSEPVVSSNASRTPAIRLRPSLRFDLLSGGNWGASMETLSYVGRIDEDPRVSTATDQEYAYRALCAGIRIVYAPDVVVRHIGWRNRDERAAQYRSYGRSLGGFYGKYARQGHWILVGRAAVKLVGQTLRLVHPWPARPEDRLRARAFLAGLIPGLIAGLDDNASAR